LSSYCLLAIVIRCFALFTCFQILHKIWKFCMQFCHLILMKIIKFVATRCQIFRLKCTKFDFGWGSAPDPAGGAYRAPWVCPPTSKSWLRHCSLLTARDHFLYHVLQCCLSFVNREHFATVLLVQSMASYSNHFFGSPGV